MGRRHLADKHIGMGTTKNSMCSKHLSHPYKYCPELKEAIAEQVKEMNQSKQNVSDADTGNSTPPTPTIAPGAVTEASSGTTRTE